MRIRRFMAVAFFAVALAGFASHFWMFYEYHSSRPNQPHPEVGRLYPSSDHSSYVYLTAGEATGLSLLIGTFLIGILLGAIVILKENPPGLTRLSRREYEVAGIAMICYLSLIILAGPSIARWVVSHGTVLNW